MISVSGDCLPFIFKLLSNCYRQKMILAKICPKIRDQQIHILSISGHCMCFIFKICQIYADISMSQSISPIFKNLIFGGFLPFGPTLRCRTTGLLPDYCIAMASCHYSGLSHEISLEIFTRLKMPACISQRIQIHHDVSFAFHIKVS